MTSLLRYIFSRIFSGKPDQVVNEKPKRHTYPDNREPTSTEWENAKTSLNDAERSASFGKLGGFRPQNPNDRCTSWWGGNFLAAPDEGIPVCGASGKLMLPVFQLRVDELLHVPKAFEGISLMVLWFDPETEHIWETSSGVGFTIRTYSSLEGLVPIGPGYKEHETMPTFPIRWHLLENDLPDWEDFVDWIPGSVARSKESDWFYDHPGMIERGKLQSDMPIKIGGYSQWWQSPQNVENGEFAFFLDSTARGCFGFPGGGNANFFRVGDTWEMRVDCT